MSSTVPETPPNPGAELKQASRSLLVDAVRGFAIILVAFGHTNQGVMHRNWWGTSMFGMRLDAYIYSFHMPAFFFVSGIFLKASIAKRGVVRFLRERFFTLLWPYVLWSCITAVALIPLARFVSQSTHPPREFAWLLLTGQISWFLPSIFFALLLTGLAVRIPLAVAFAVSLGLAALRIQTPFVFISDGIHFLPFLLLGMAIGPKISRISRLPIAASLLLAAVAALGIGVVTQLSLQHTFAGYLLTGFVGTAMLFFFSRCVEDTKLAKWLAWAGAASLAIFLLSEFPQGGGRAVLVSVFHTTQPVVQDVVPTILAVVLPAWLYHRRYALKIAWMFEWPFAGDTAKPGPRSSERALPRGQAPPR